MKLGINLEPFAVLNKVCQTQYLGLNYYAVCADMAGCDSLVLKITTNREFLTNDDFRKVRETYKGYLVLKIPYDEELIKFCISYKPNAVIIYNESGNKGSIGLNLEENRDLLEDVKFRLYDAGISTYLSIDPDVKLVKLASRIGVAGVELITNHFGLAKSDYHFSEALEELRLCAMAGQKLHLNVFASGNLNYNNIRSLKMVDGIDEVILGKALLAKSSLIGLDQAVKEIKHLLER